MGTIYLHRLGARERATIFRKRSLNGLTRVAVVLSLFSFLRFSFATAVQNFENEQKVEPCMSDGVNAADCELMQRINDALRSRTFLTPDFYESESLKSFFGTDAVEWLTKARELKGGNLRASASQLRSDWKPFVSFKFIPRSTSTPKSSAFIVLDGSSHITLSDIKAVFGDSPTIEGAFDDPSFQHGHPWPISASTDPTGNKRITYDLTKDAFEGRLWFRTDAAGKVNHVSISQKEL